jgi:tRNA threonylcarbamoyladenosine biosynthesis protein TsaB
MKILALEFSSTQRSVAVAEGDANAKLIVRGVAHESGTKETKAFSLIEAALASAHWSRTDIDCIVVGLGPGSYTGIRVAISIAQGWELARELKLLGISTVEALAHQAKSQRMTGSINIAIDAHRNEFYLATASAEAPVSELRNSLRLVSAAEIDRLISSGAKVIGPDLQQCFPTALHLWPEASALAQLAADRADFVMGEQLEPIYLRAPTFVKAPPPRLIP